MLNFKSLFQFQAHNWLWVLLSIVIIGFDQWTKYLATVKLPFEMPVTVTSFLNWTLVHNHGASFSFLAGASGWQRYALSILAAVASVMFFFWLMRLSKELKVLAAALAFILAGAVGNLIDRISLGYVVDFIQFHYQYKSFPVFNVADISINIGAFLLIIDTFVLEKRRHKSQIDE